MTTQTLADTFAMFFRGADEVKCLHCDETEHLHPWGVTVWLCDKHYAEAVERDAVERGAAAKRHAEFVAMAETMD